MARIYLHTGSNLGNRLENLKKAIFFIKTQIGSIDKISSIYQTAAWGIEKQPPFLNQALEISSDLSPLETLERIATIEKHMGRKKIIKWGERIIDIDILFYEDQIIQSKTLSIPHPEIQNRKFVLVPLAEIGPEFIHPVLKLSTSDLLKNCKDPLAVKKFTESEQ